MSARTEYAVRACLELARNPGTALSAETLATRADLPPKFLEAILTELRTHGIVATQRGPNGGTRLARPAERITVADLIRAVEGPLADVRGVRPEHMAYPERDRILTSLWIAGRAAIRSVFEATTLADLARGELPPDVAAYLSRPGAWNSTDRGGPPP